MKANTAKVHCPVCSKLVADGAGLSAHRRQSPGCRVVQPGPVAPGPEPGPVQPEPGPVAPQPVAPTMEEQISAAVRAAVQAILTPQPVAPQPVALDKLSSLALALVNEAEDKGKRAFLAMYVDSPSSLALALATLRACTLLHKGGHTAIVDALTIPNMAPSSLALALATLPLDFGGKRDVPRSLDEWTACAAGIRNALYASLLAARKLGAIPAAGPDTVAMLATIPGSRLSSAVAGWLTRRGHKARKVNAAVQGQPVNLAPSSVNL